MEGKRICSDSTAHSHSKKIRSSSHLQIPSDEGIADLPEGIIQEILLRLPVKSLLKSRCVSKSWLSLISSPQFVETHLKLSTGKADSANHRIIFTLSNPSFNLKECSVNSLISEPRTIASNIDYPSKSPHSAVWIVGSVNGLICIAIDEKDVFLWNPSTRKSKELPSAGVEMKPGFYYLWGFGYCESEDDYKVVGLFCVYGNGGLQESVVKIYSLRADSWKRIEDFTYGVPFNDTGKFASGRLHFGASQRMEFDSKWDIVSLDLRSEAYGVVEKPKYEEGCTDFSLGLLGSCLSVLCDYREKERSDLWVLKESSWSRVVSIRHFFDPVNFVYVDPLLIMPNGGILLAFKEGLVVYNPKDEPPLRYLQISHVQRFLEADIYFESLVPL